MTGPHQRIDELRRSLVEAHRSEQRDPAKKAAGLDALLAAEAGSPPAPKKKSGPALVGGVVLVTLLGGAAGWFALRQSGEPEARPADSSTEPVAVLPVTPPAKAVAPSDAPPTTEQLREAPVAQPPIAQPPSTIAPAVVERRPTAPPADDPDLLAKELALVDLARSQRKSDPAEALKTLDRYAREFPRGGLRQEAAIVRVEVLLALGRRSEAEALAKNLSSGGGLVKKRLDRLLGSP